MRSVSEKWVKLGLVNLQYQKKVAQAYKENALTILFTIQNVATLWLCRDPEAKAFESEWSGVASANGHKRGAART